MVSVRQRPDWSLPERLATPETTFWDRRQVLRGLGLAGAGLLAGACAPSDDPRYVTRPALGARYAERFPAPRNDAYGLGDDRRPTPEIIAAKENNFYELTQDKWAVWELAQRYARRHPPEPWTVEVGGLVHRPRTLDLDDLLTGFELEERLYRFRCVERWAMQVPWTGFPLARLIDACNPLGSARYVRFVSFLDPRHLPGQRAQDHYPWPYFEALRLDEARHPLAFAVVGVYGHALPMQHGAPWRLAIPWKYGYKGPKSVVRIELLAERPETFWHTAAPDEYGFFSNVDPHKPHPRWSQEVEIDIGTGDRRPSLPYNGYTQVAGLYDGREA